MQYRLRTLLIVLALGPPVMALVWPFVETWLFRHEALDLDEFRRPFSGAVELNFPAEPPD